MSINTADEYKDFFNEDTRHQTKVEKLKRKWIRVKDGVDIYSISRPKLVSLAMEAGAAYKIDSVILIDKEMFETYLESFRIPGVIAK